MSKFDLAPFVEPLRRYAWVLTRGDHKADDMVQGALLRAVERRATFHEWGDLRVWLLAISHNHFIDQTRARRAALARDHAWAETNPGFAPPEGEHVVRLEQLRRACCERRARPALLLRPHLPCQAVAGQSQCGAVSRQHRTNLFPPPPAKVFQFRCRPISHYERHQRNFMTGTQRLWNT